MTCRQMRYSKEMSVLKEYEVVFISRDKLRMKNTACVLLFNTACVLLFNTACALLFLQVAIKIIDKTQLNQSSLQKVCS